MKFVNPLFLFALFSLAIPIIIHLFNFRKFKRIYFTNVRLLKEVNLDTKARNKLKNLLILACRLLTVFFLVSAFAQPYIPQENAAIRTGDKAVSIFIDNSFSMDAIGKNGTLLDEAKKNAKEIAAAYKATDRFQLLTNDFEGRHQRLVNREEFLSLVDEVKSSPSVRTLSEITKRQQDALNTEPGIQPGNKQAFIISDFQKTITDPAKIKTDSSIVFKTLQLFAQSRNNIFVDSAWFSSPVRNLNSPEQLHIRIRSKSDQEMVNVPMRLYLNGEARTPSSFSIQPNGTIDTSIYFTIREPGLQQGLVEINDDQVTFDDRLYFSFNVLKAIPILSVNPSPDDARIHLPAGLDYPDSLFGKDSSFKFTESEEKKLDYSSFSGFRFIVLNNLPEISSGLATELKNFVNQGGSIFIFPGENINLASYNDLLSQVNAGMIQARDTMNTVVDRLSYDHPLYQGVFEKQSGNIDLPVVYDHYKIVTGSRTTGEPLMHLRNGDPFVVDWRSGKGSVYLCAVPTLDAWSNFPQHALFVPTLDQAAYFSEPQGNLFYTIGSDENIDIGDPGVAGENAFHLSNPKLSFDVIPVHTIIDGHTILDVHREVKDPGNYIVKLGPDNVGGISFNYDRKESDLSTNTSDELSESFATAGLKNFSALENDGKGITAALTEIDNGKRYWKICIWLSLLFLLGEILIIRFWKNSAITTKIKTTPITR